jgi:septal ring factor EnvC (AmiA/AmiB activator)
VSLFFLDAAAQNIDDQLQNNRQALSNVRDEIEVLKKEITKTNIKSSSNLEQIKRIEKELALISKAKQLLQRENNLLKNKISATQKKLENKTVKLKELQKHYVRRVVYNYKYGRIQNLELLINAETLNQVLVRYKYLKYFAEQETRLINKIKFQIEEIQFLKQSLNETSDNLKMSFQEKEREHKKYVTRKKQKQSLVKTLQWTITTKTKVLEQKQEEYKKLYQIIVALERQRKLRERRGNLKEAYSLNLKDFKKAKGKLPWPVKGSIIHKYGKQRDPILKTTINNTGIDIKAKTGTEVHSVFTGIVSMITNLSGYGNTVILDHGDGYYTVYSHLDEIFVDTDDLVTTGKIIGLVGNSGSLEGSKLHFALFTNQKPENPQKWLQ